MCTHRNTFPLLLRHLFQKLFLQQLVTHSLYQRNRNFLNFKLFPWPENHLRVAGEVLNLVTPFQIQFRKYFEDLLVKQYRKKTITIHWHFTPIQLQFKAFLQWTSPKKRIQFISIILNFNNVDVVLSIKWESSNPTMSPTVRKLTMTQSNTTTSMLPWANTTNHWS